MANKKYIGIEVLGVLTIPPPVIPLPPPPPPPDPFQISNGRWVDISRDGSTIAVGQSTPSFTGGSIHMRRGANFATDVTLTSTLGSVKEYGNTIATNADGSIVVCGALRTGDITDGYAAVRHGIDWADETIVEPSGASDFLTYSGGIAVGISDDGSIIVLTDGTKVFICSGTDWTDVIELNPGSGGVWSVAISGDGTVVAAGNGTDKVHIYSGDSYATHTVIIPSDLVSSESFGWSVALNSDGSILAVGNQTHGYNPPTTYAQHGAGYVYTGAGWATEQIFQNPIPFDTGDHFGWGTSISADGSVVAFTAWHKDPTGIVFRYSGSDYSIETQELRPSGGGIGSFGLDISLNENGSIMAVTESSVWVFSY